MKNKLLTMAATLVVLTGLGHYFAKPLLAQVRAALVRDVDNPALQPVMFPIGDNPQTFHVPAGKRLVIEYVSWRGTVNQGFVVAVGLNVKTNGVEGTHYIPGSPVSGENIGGQKVSIMADPNTDVVYQSAGSIGAALVLVSGYYVNIP
jgi:hypothetical protein